MQQVSLFLSQSGHWSFKGQKLRHFLFLNLGALSLSQILEYLFGAISMNCRFVQVERSSCVHNKQTLNQHTGFYFTREVPSCDEEARKKEPTSLHEAGTSTLPWYIVLYCTL